MQLGVKFGADNVLKEITVEKKTGLIYHMFTSTGYKLLFCYVPLIDLQDVPLDLNGRLLF